MADSFKSFLAQSEPAPLSEDLRPDVLKGTKEWEQVNAKDPVFAKKLLVAWEGDARDYEKNRLGDPLFTKMVQPDSVKKLSKITLDDQMKDAFRKLDGVFYKAMPKHAKTANQTKDVWWHERHVREYVELRTEVNNSLLTESVSDTLYQRLIRYKNSLEVDDAERCEIDADDEKTIKSDIESKLTAGWTEAEVFQYMKNMEYFDDYTHDEDTCLANMSAVKKRVQARLK